MTKKSSGSGNAPVKIKAKKGAWWNSQVESDEQATSTVSPKPEEEISKVKKSDKQKESVTAVPSDSASSKKRKSHTRKSAGRVSKKPLSKQKRQKETNIQQESASQTVKLNQEQTAVEKEVKPKKQPRKRGRKPKVTVEQKEGVEKSTEQEATGTDSDTSPQGMGEPAIENQSASDRRGNRGKRNKTRAKKNDVVSSGASPAEDKDTKVAKGEVQAEEKPKVIRLLVNAEEPEECRLALLEDGRLQSLHVSTVNRTQTKSNIYKARIVAIEPNLQAAFVDYGTPKNGFLPFSEIHPEYYKKDLGNEVRTQLENGQWKRLKIEDAVERGQELLVQVVKEEVGKKGANMTTFLSLPGRCVVLMPGSDSTGISRKISGETKRSQLREIMQSFAIPEGIGWIVRTASNDITKKALSRDVQYLLKLWEEIRSKGQSLENVGLIYEDHRSVMRFLREHFDPSIQEILVDDRVALQQVQDFIELLPARQQNVKVRLHRGARPIFNQFSIEDQIESIYQPQVNLPSGGSIVINPTEALVAIDVNSGSTSKGQNFEESIFQANMEAAAELARQLRLRDLGGLVVVDFIDMRNKKHIREVEKQVKLSMKRDKAKVDFSRISKFGLMQISRQKLGSPIEAANYRVCQHCKGRGTVKSVETLALFYLRRIQTGASRNPVVKVECHFPMDVASYLLNNKRHEIHEFENKYGAEILIIADATFNPAENEIIFHKREKEQEMKK